jgi:hypothetical protein
MALGYYKVGTPIVVSPPPSRRVEGPGEEET